MNTMVQTLRGMGQIKLAALIGVGILLVALFTFISLRVTSPSMSPLYSGLPMEDSAHIVAQLEKNGVPYELRADGAQIMVPSDQVTRLRMMMAQDGLPSSGSIVGYEIFDRADALGTSNFVMNVNMIRALEGELGRTIGSFKQVETARVHLVMPKRELFTRDRQEPTASVALKLRGNNELSKSEIGAITHLVATAVPGLKAGRITIVDNKGALLAKGAGEGEASAVNSEAEEYRIAYESRMRRTLEELLAKSLGADRVQVHITADIDFDRIVTNSETFDPESQVARSVQNSEETEHEQEKDINDNVSVANNLPDKEASEAGTVNSRDTARTDETTNFEISKVVENHVRETGTVKRMSVAVLVDGTYTKEENEEGKPTLTYTPRPQAELDQIATLVRSAIGYDEKRGDTVQVVNMQFSDTPEMEVEQDLITWFKENMQGIVQTLVIGGIAILVILIIIRPLVNRVIATAAANEAAEEEAVKAALAGPAFTPALEGGAADGDEDEEALINIDRIKGRVKSGTYRKINEMIDKHPEETLTIIRQWVFKDAA